ncbi:MAG: LytTR family transcriptional regulator, partial [Porticoccaceae bacterium]|nr:LytTR family transcriptional regulator [Porticoccaceae bacterium]
DGKYVTARHLKGESLLEESLSQLEQQFSDTFVRCHRAALVRISSIQKLGKSADGSAFLTLSDDGENIPVSRRHAAQIREILLSRG